MTETFLYSHFRLRVLQISTAQIKEYISWEAAKNTGTLQFL